MSKPSILRKLSDRDLVEIHHQMRKDALSDLQIARAAEKMLGVNLGSDAAAGMVIARYRKSAPFKKWLTAWENQDAELRKAIETQRQRFEFVSSLVKGSDNTGIETVSNGLLARLLTLATGMSDEELLEAAAGKRGWVARIIGVINDQTRRERNAEASKAVAVAADEKLSPEEREKRMKEIFGMK